MNKLRVLQVFGAPLFYGNIMSMDIIRSKDNSKVKRLTLLHDRKKASKEGLVFIEGTRLCEDALLSGVKPQMFAFSESRNELAKQLIDKYGIDCEIVALSDDCFEKIANTVNPQGIAMVVSEPELGSEIPFSGNDDIYLCLEGLQDPGNMGTVIRLADAFGFSAVIMVKGTVDPFNEKVLRASMGSVWHVPLRRAESVDDVFEYCKKNNIVTLAAHLKGAPLNEAELTLPCCYFIGNEGNGLSDECSSRCDTMVKIPMQGKAESLNAASAASIIGYILSTKRK